MTAARRSLVLLSRHGGGTGVSGPVIRVTSDVRYSSVHRRNVLDVYERRWIGPAAADADAGASAVERGRGDPGVADGAASRQPSDCWVLFVHGGMWLRGDKNRPTLSAYDVFSSVYWGGDDGGRDPLHRHRSNVGRTVAAAGGVGCVMNYRLASPARVNPDGGDAKDDEGCVRHPDQVMDVARCIAFLSLKIPLGSRLYVGGHSAGAHLAALALADTRYLDAAFAERNLPGVSAGRGYSDLIGGFFGLSGVYNLPRLGMDPITAPLTVGPAFGRGEGGGGVGTGTGRDVLREASPLHALLRAESSEIIPPLARIPVLLLNAEDGNDWGLERDSEELLIALRRFDESRFDEIRGVDGDGDGDGDPMPPPARSHHLISNRNHFSIERMFGEGMELFWKEPPHQQHAQGDPFDASSGGRDRGGSSSEPMSRKAMPMEGKTPPNHKENVAGRSTETGWYDALLAGGGRIVGGYVPNLGDLYASAVGYVWPSPSADVAAREDDDGVSEMKEGDVDEAALLVLRFLGLIPPPSSSDPPAGGTVHGGR